MKLRYKTFKQAQKEIKHFLDLYDVAPDKLEINELCYISIGWSTMKGSHSSWHYFNEVVFNAMRTCNIRGFQLKVDVDGIDHFPDFIIAR